jgi:predicted oxidoreductase
MASIGPSNGDRIPLGQSGIAVPPLGWGMWRLSASGPASPRALVETALEMGFLLFDTADVYGVDAGGGFGEAERLLGAVFREAPALRRQIVLATKVGIVPGAPYNSDSRYLIEACEASLKRLGVDHVDLLHIHRPDLLTHPAEVAKTFMRLREDGKIRAAGVSNYSAAHFDALRQYLPQLAVVQNEFSALAIEPLSDGTLDAAMRWRAGVLAWSPLAQGRLAAPAGESSGDARTDRVIAALDEVARRAGVPRTAVAYAWIMVHPARPIPLVGSQNPARLREAALAYKVEMTREEWYRILVAARGADMP